MQVVHLFQCHQFCAVCPLVLHWAMTKGLILGVGWDYFPQVDMDMGPYRYASNLYILIVIFFMGLLI